ncbi:hypothetical protein [Streptomyces olivaceoviridis]|uniref:hypothetical protein n=1 Tax=Streptomyces olivaceoviridis TaxID=1921 RepID=UPI0037BD785B
MARRERTLERLQESTRKQADLAARYFLEHGHLPEDPEPTRTVTEWSRKSRARMTRRLAELDYGPMLRTGLRLPMTTLTYPGDWETVAPTGKVVKEHLKAYRKRFERAWGFTPLAIWKLEFQRRGAPHIHLWGPEPEGTAGELRRLTQRRYRPAVGDGLPYREWLSVVWADIVDHPDPEQKRRHIRAGTAVDFREGERMRDPRRLAVYFTKHGSYRAKEYQHQVPDAWAEPGAGPGRFWGYWGLDPATAGVELDPATAVWAGRILRRYAHAQGTTKLTRNAGGVVVKDERVRITQQRAVRRVQGGDPIPTDRVVGLAGAQLLAPVRVRYRTVRRPVVRLGNGRGFLCVNDGPALASTLARALDVVTAPAADSYRRRTGPVQGGPVRQ